MFAFRKNLLHREAQSFSQRKSPQREIIMKKLLLLCIVFFAISCENSLNRSSVPIAPVSIRINLHHFPHLLATPFTNEYFTEVDQSIGVFAVGFGGVLITTFMNPGSINVQYAAFDMACPYELDRNTRVFPDDTGFFAVCETCGSRFDLSSGLGILAEGPAREHLRRLNVHREGNYLRVMPRNY